MGRVCVLCLAAAVLLGTATNQNPDPVQLEELFDAALTAAEEAKGYYRSGNTLSVRELDRVEGNLRRVARDSFDGDDLNDDAKHFVKSVDDNFGDDLIDHFQECPVCNPLINAILRGANIARIRLRTDVEIASVCVTPYGTCPMAVSIPVGSACYCPTPYGPVWGVAR